MAARLGGDGADSSSGGEPSDIQWHGWRKWWWTGGGGGGGGKGGDSDESQERDGTYTFEWDISLLLSIRTALDT